MSQEEIKRRVHAMLDSFSGVSHEVALYMIIASLSRLFVILLAKKIFSQNEAMYILTGKEGYIAGGIDNEKT